ncbi:MAG: adenine phosphoribosyltransferase [Bacteriovoracaceae bacterium]|nr:adenine phosphoribosyltransferase [Bacteriovoracaceae bacterium]
MNKEQYEKYIIDIPNFPKEGVTFKDMTPLLEHKFNELIEDFYDKVNWDEVDAVVGIESRGFILGAALAQKANVGFIPIRKKGKLPPKVISESYSLEYGEDIIEMKVNETAKKVILIDDVLATGGTLTAALNLCKRNNVEVQNILMLINLTFLNNLKENNSSIVSLLEY